MSNADLDRKVVALDHRRNGFALYRDLTDSSTKEWLVHGLLGHGEASVFYGKPGDGKSVLAEDLGLHIAAGMTWHDRKVKQGGVVYIALERRKLVERRAIAFRQRHGHADLPFAIIDGVQQLSIFGETDASSARAVRVCGQRWRKAGRRVRVVMPNAGADLNDALLRERATS